MIRGTKINYPEFISYVQTAPITEYLSKFRSPILLGRKIVEGDITKGTFHDYNQTFLFQENEEQQSIYVKSIKKIMFMLRKTEDHNLKTHSFSIGRDGENDIVIVDYTISKLHAQIQFTERGYVLIDFRSRNGSSINGMSLVPNRAYPIQERDIILFGRIGFVLLSPISIFVSYRQFQKKQHYLKGDCREVAEKSSLALLRKVADKNKIVHLELSKEDLISRLLKQIKPIPLLFQLCS